MCTLVPKIDGANIIGTKWIFKNKTDVKVHVTRNKTCLVAQGYAQVEEANFDEPLHLLLDSKLYASHSAYHAFISLNYIRWMSRVPF